MVPIPFHCVGEVPRTLSPLEQHKHAHHELERSRPAAQAQRSPCRASGRVPGAQQGLLGTSYRTLRASVEVLQTGIFAATALTVANIAVIADPFNFLNPLDHLVAVHGICTQAQGTTVNIR